MPAFNNPAGKVRLLAPIDEVVSVKVLATEFQVQAIGPSDVPPMRTEIPLLTQFDAAFVVNAPMFTVTVVTGLSAAVQF